MVLARLRAPLCSTVSSVAPKAPVGVVVVTIINHDSFAINNFCVLLGLLRLLLNKSKHIPPDVLRDVSDFAA